MIMPVILSGVCGIFGLIIAVRPAVGLCTIASLPSKNVQTEMVMKSIMPVILSGVCGIFGLIIAVIISSTMDPTKYSLFSGYAHLGAGLTVGLSNLATGLALGMSGEIGVQDSALQPKLYIGMVLIWSFGSALGLYGLIVALIIAVKPGSDLCDCHWVGDEIQCGVANALAL